jgi:hypothetical protein
MFPNNDLRQLLITGAPPIGKPSAAVALLRINVISLFHNDVILGGVSTHCILLPAFQSFAATGHNGSITEVVF